uniref:EF-hand domain-containing protein n=1 Tax=Kalanchoe fedtschenkoi TaxID=63787 RepID=A0A7N0V2V9_KALFE
MAQMDGSGLVFQDFFPAMVEKLGSDGFMKELCNGFGLLVDGERGVITAESLKRNAALLGMEEMSEDEARSMVREGDLDGDGVLNQTEFCVLMCRLSPGLMTGGLKLLEQAILTEF